MNTKSIMLPYNIISLHLKTSVNEGRMTTMVHWLFTKIS